MKIVASLDGQTPGGHHGPSRILNIQKSPQLFGFKRLDIKFDTSILLNLLWLILWVTIWGIKADEYPSWVFKRSLVRGDNLNRGKHNMNVCVCVIGKWRRKLWNQQQMGLQGKQFPWPKHSHLFSHFWRVRYNIHFPLWVVGWVLLEIWAHIYWWKMSENSSFHQAVLPSSSYFFIVKYLTERWDLFHFGNP